MKGVYEERWKESARKGKREQGGGRERTVVDEGRCKERGGNKENVNEQVGKKGRLWMN